MGGSLWKKRQKTYFLAWWPCDFSMEGQENAVAGARLSGMRVCQENAVLRPPKKKLVGLGACAGGGAVWPMLAGVIKSVCRSVYRPHTTMSRGIPLLRSFLFSHTNGLRLRKIG